MTIEEMRELFDLYAVEHGKFERIQKSRGTRRPDLHAFLLLDSLFHGFSDIVAGAEHDMIYLDSDPKKLASVISESEILELVRCGCLLLFISDSLAMYV